MAHKPYVLHLPYYNSRLFLLHFTSLICHFHFCALFLPILSSRLRFSYTPSLLPNVVTSLASCFPPNRDTNVSSRTSRTTCQSLEQFYNDESRSMFLPNSGDYLHGQITSPPSTPHYSYLDEGGPARTASRAALLGSNQVKATFLFIKSNVR